VPGENICPDDPQLQIFLPGYLHFQAGVTASLNYKIQSRAGSNNSRFLLQNTGDRDILIAGDSNPEDEDYLNLLIKSPSVVMA
jgi:hypothetical protein